MLAIRGELASRAPRFNEVICRNIKTIGSAFRTIEAFQIHFALAGRFYSERQLQVALEHYRKAGELASECGAKEAVEHCCSMSGVTLYQLGRLKEALAELSPFLKTEGTPVSPRTAYEVPYPLHSGRAEVAGIPADD